MLPVAATPPDRGSARKYKLVGKPSYIRHEIHRTKCGTTNMLSFEQMRSLLLRSIVDIYSFFYLQETPRKQAAVLSLSSKTQTIKNAPWAYTSLKVDLEARSHSTLQVKYADVLPVLLQQRGQEVGGQDNVGLDL